MRDKSGLLRPAYNHIITTNNQFIVNTTMDQNSADNVGFKNHVEKLLSWREGALKPESYVGDAGFGNEENYEYLELEEINNYLKYNTFHYEDTQEFKNKIYHPDNMDYDPENDTYTCPQGRILTYQGEEKRETATGYQVIAKVYECDDCSQCKVKDQCFKGDGGYRRFTKSKKLEHYKQQARDNLNSETGIELRRRRGFDVETPFADIKYNMGKRKLSLRGIEKTSMEMIWISLAHNMRKIAKIAG